MKVEDIGRDRWAVDKRLYGENLPENFWTASRVRTAAGRVVLQLGVKEKPAAPASYCHADAGFHHVLAEPLSRADRFSVDYKVTSVTQKQGRGVKMFVAVGLWLLAGDKEFTLASRRRPLTGPASGRLELWPFLPPRLLGRQKILFAGEVEIRYDAEGEGRAYGEVIAEFSNLRIERSAAPPPDAARSKPERVEPHP